MSDVALPKSVFPYDKASYEEVPCNFCEGRNYKILADHDRNGLPTHAVICTDCGLIFVNPRMTKEWYDLYYQREYRQQMARLRGKETEGLDLDRMFVGVFSKSKALFEYLKPYFNSSGLTIDVGSSVGGALAAFRDVIGGSVLGIEPSKIEAGYAIKKGINTEITLFEDFHKSVGTAANVMSLRNLNHLLDPKSFLQWAWYALGPGGRLILMVQNFRLSAKKLGLLERAVQIDHVYMFVPEVLEAFVQHAGFDIVYALHGESFSIRELHNSSVARLAGGRTILVASKSDRIPFSSASSIPRNYKRVAKSLSRNAILRYYIPLRIYQKVFLR